MPQMSPMNWFLMFCFFSMILIIIVNKIFHIYNILITSNETNDFDKNYNFKNWKW